KNPLPVKGKRFNLPAVPPSFVMIAFCPYLLFPSIFSQPNHLVDPVNPVSYQTKGHWLFGYLFTAQVTMPSASSPLMKEI
ncbi:MAG: hypothetical protein JXC36_01100, partial [Candidatus Atribacteria bacterium]|nr:hypothetical protein [Candidatus Atribacteria bacterium]